MVTQTDLIMRITYKHSGQKRPIEIGKKLPIFLFQFHEKNNVLIYSCFFFHSYIRFGKRALQHPHTKKDQNSEDEDVLNSLNFLQV